MSKKSNLKLKEYLSEDGKLDLSILALKTVPDVDEILALRKVKSIDLSNNQIESLPNDFGKLDGVHTIDLSKNRLTSLPDTFGQLKSLKQLDLFENQISSLPLSFAELTKLEYLDLKNNPLEENLQTHAGKCLNKKECRLCAQRVLQYISQLKEEHEKEEALKLKKKQANERAKAKKREKQAEKDREAKRMKRLEQSEKRRMERDQMQQHSNEDEDSQSQNDDDNENRENDDEQSEGWVSQIVDGILNGLLLSLMGVFTWEMYQNRQQQIDFFQFYKHI